MNGSSRRARTRAILEALDQRVVEAARVLLPEGKRLPDPVREGGGRTAAELLPQLVATCENRPGPAVWLVMTAISGAFPLASEVEDVARQLELGTPEDVVEGLLARVFGSPGVGRVDLPMRIVSDRVVLDADYCARDDKHTGIQRVVRETARRWFGQHGVLGVAHLDERSAYRALAPREESRVFSHGEDLDIDPAVEREYRHQLIVPWRTTVVWSEVLEVNACLRMAGMAQYSGNSVGLIAYDMIPIVSAHLRHLGEAGVFGQFLHAVKHAHRVAGISISAAAEFQAFSDMLSAQGLTGPVVREIELPEDAGDPHLDGPHRSPERPVVLLTGSREPHKNHRAAVHAAERLWHEGLDFEVVMLGGHGWDERLLMDNVTRLQKEGRPLTMLGWVSDDEMWRRVRDASFVVFTSLHEGYGLLVAEALACGTPVITSDFGSQREIAAKGGCLLVDPRNDEAITEAMRTLISDPSRTAGLRAQILRRPRRTWDDYAQELWSFLVQGPLESAKAVR